MRSPSRTLAKQVSSFFAGRKYLKVGPNRLDSMLLIFQVRHTTQIRPYLVDSLRVAASDVFMISYYGDELGVSSASSYKQSAET